MQPICASRVPVISKEWSGNQLSSIRILIVDDFGDWRRTVLSLFQAQPGWQVIAEATDGAEAIEKAETLNPDLIVLDIGLPKLNGIEAARQIRDLSPSSKILFLSDNNDLDVVRAALGTAQSFVCKTDFHRDFLPGVRAALRGQPFVSSSLKHHKLIDAAEERAPYSHEVQFYSDDDVFLETVAVVIAAGLKSGSAAIAILTDSHRKALVSKLKAHGLDIDAATQQGIYIPLDVTEILSTFMVDGMPDADRFFEVGRGLIETAAKAAKQQQCRVVVCGECSPTLWGEGKADAAIRVEQLFDQVGRTFGLDTFCGYATTNFHGEEGAQMFQRICAEHSAVHP